MSKLPLRFALACFLAVGFLSFAAAQPAEPGTLYALVFDNVLGEEVVVIVDPATASFTPVGSSVPDCCTIGGFPVFGLNSVSGTMFAPGNLFSDGAVPKRLLGFDVFSGALTSFPFLPMGFNYNVFTLGVGSGSVYGLVFDFVPSEEQVVSVDPSSGMLTPLGSTIADCCTLGGFPVAAVDEAAGVLYGAGNLLSDPAGPRRLLGFDLGGTGLVSMPFLPAGFNYNMFEFDPLSGMLYGLVFDMGANQETVVTVNPATAALTPVGPGVNDCCTVNTGFATLDPHNQVFYTLGNLFSDPAGSSQRLLGFDVTTGALVSMPFMPSGYNFNILRAAVVLPLVVEIDIKPGSFPNAVNPRSLGLIPVAILTTSLADGDSVDFDASDVNPSSVAFGPGGAGIAHPGGHLEDVDGDGDLDLVLHFPTRQTGIACGDTEASLTGATFGGQTFSGTDSLKTSGCK